MEAAEKQTGKQFHHSGAIPVTKDSFQIATLTCSTKLTQNGATSCFLFAAVLIQIQIQYNQSNVAPPQSYQYTPMFHYL